MNPSEQAKVLLLYIQVGMKVFATRIALYLAMAMTFSLACWTMWDPVWQRILTTGLFGVLVFLPTLSLDRSGTKEFTRTGG